MNPLCIAIIAQKNARMHKHMQHMHARKRAHEHASTHARLHAQPTKQVPQPPTLPAPESHQGGRAEAGDGHRHGTPARARTRAPSHLAAHKRLHTADKATDEARQMPSRSGPPSR